MALHPSPSIVAQKIIEISELKRNYVMGDEEVRALDGLNFNINKGEFVAIEGSSGSGKTTLMSILGCLDKPTSGHYKLDSADVSELSDDALSETRNQKIGFVFQSFQLMPRASAIRNVALPLVYRGCPKSERDDRAEEALAKVGLSHRLTHRPNQLSGGQRQRVSIARALVTEPSLLLADEPTGNLDSKTETDILGLFHELHQDQNTIILVTHEPSVASSCPRSIKLSDGLIIHDTNPS